MNTRIIGRSLFSLLSLFVSFCLYAASDEEGAALGVKLGALLTYDSEFKTFKEQCTRTEGTAFDPKEMHRANPSAFAGISPTSQYWPQIEEAYSTYTARMCSAVTPEDVARIIGSALAKELSKADMRAAITFYSSAEGQRFQRANLHANQVLRQTMTKSMKDFMFSDSHKQMNQKLQAIFAAYQKNPK